MFARRETHRHAIPLAGQTGLTNEFREIARFWVSAKRSFVVVAPDVVASPSLLGSLLVECVHTAATGYAATAGISEEQARADLWSGFDEERARLAKDDSNEEIH